MGGNLVLKLLGEWGEQAPPQVKAGVGVSPAMDLAASADALHDPGQSHLRDGGFFGACAGASSAKPRSIPGQL